MKAQVIFSTEGVPWVPMPELPRNVDDPDDRKGRSVAVSVLQALLRFGRNRVEVGITDKFIAEYIGRSVSSVQRGLRKLETLGMIVRVAVGSARCRTIRLLLRVRASLPKLRTAKGTGQKNLPPPLLKNGQGDCSEMINAPSFEGVTSKNPQAVVVDEGDGTPSPPTAEEPRTAAEAMAAMMAAAQSARAAAPEAPTPAQDGPTAGAPIVPASAPAVTPRAALRLAIVRDIEVFERMAAEGDKAAATELPYLRARLEQFDAKSPPADDPPGVGSAGEPA